MPKLIYTAISSVDGYIEDDRGDFGWAFPGLEVHSFVNDLERTIGVHLYGRRMYDTMVFWETQDGDTAVGREYAQIWRAAEKVVFSRSLNSVASARTRIERELTPAVIRRLKATSTSDLAIGGAEIAGQALLAGLVDEVRLLLAPTLVGGGKPTLPGRIRSELKLRETRAFSNGFVYLGYDVRA